MLTAKARISVNENCPYKLQYGIVNRTQIEKKKEPKRYRYGKKSVTVYHYGEHSCPVIKKPKKGVECIEQLVENNPNIKPS